VLAAMKGVYPAAELESLPADVRVREVIALDVPHLDAERHLVLMECA
jgi:16S rRNA (guanine527-N7)-methyltransferase